MYARVCVCVCVCVCVSFSETRVQTVFRLSEDLCSERGNVTLTLVTSVAQYTRALNTLE